MNRTLLGSGRVKVRGGALLVVSGEASAAPRLNARETLQVIRQNR
jgi:hypothetical protein